MLSLAIILALLMCFSAFFSASETALFSLSRLQVHRFKEAGGRSAESLISLLRTPRHTLVTILFGNELANACISIVGAAMISRMLHLDVMAEEIVAIAVITPVIMVFCEIVPKNMALHFAEGLVPIMVAPIQFFYTLISPFRRGLTWFAKKMISLFGGDLDRDAPMIMENEFRRMVDIGHREGAIEEEEREIIHKVFEFTNKRVGDIMTPIDRVLMLSAELPYDRLMDEIRSTQFSRVPVYDGERSNIIGVLHVRDLFSFDMKRKEGAVADIRSILRMPVFVDAKSLLEDVLREFKEGKAHLTIVIDHDRAVKGIVTMDDVLNELFGEIEE
jgi:CBS domain containing-hemolysin-like protein